MNLQASPGAPAILHFGAAALLFLHIAGGSVGIVAGYVTIFARRGGWLHRRAGTVFFVAMLFMTVIAAGVAPFLNEDQWTNTTAAVFALYLVTTGWAAARRPAGELGLFERMAVLAPLGIAALGLAMISGLARSYPAEDFASVYIFAAVSALAAVCDLRMIRRGGIRGPGRIARHLWRMGAALFVATGSFFFGQQAFLPAPIRESVLPAVLGLAPLVLMAFWLVRTRFPRLARLTPATP
ncbi:MAG: hypothetical protein KKE02_14385 [Alphaproteobacteria bacterium]|nr:hypothetical protein [Alphaproteobacteria bacterium]MBU1513180.1 hypothetical protein [Alphaproteobacteria bacterium]MBU2095288.1 hypothetical protein [Alphaproteobacteria bacterium]MBU2152203.1 hypothetical protein [Alphaproteobacteria bacterium]MBU2306750.1 hypothetical protein [Alphaproteobacteria bacterium]